MGRPSPIANALTEAISGLEVGQAIKLSVKRGQEDRSFDLTLAAEPDALPAELPPASDPSNAPAAQPAGERPADAPPVGRFAVKLPEFKNECLAYVPEAYDPRVFLCPGRLAAPARRL